MLRTILLSALAATALAGCATDYTYRGGNGGDYYYGRPQTEYRYYDPYGASSYGFGGYYYDRFGRPVYAYPYGYGGYYGRPYSGYGYPYWYRPRPRPHHDGDSQQDGHGDNDRKPPWRNLDGLVPRTASDGDPRPRRQGAPLMRPMPQRTAPMPRMRGNADGGSRMGGVIRRAKTAPTPEE